MKNLLATIPRAPASSALICTRATFRLLAIMVGTAACILVASAQTADIVYPVSELAHQRLIIHRALKPSNILLLSRNIHERSLKN